MRLIKKITCYLYGHGYVLAGSCPYTGKTYAVCVECGKMVVQENIE